MRISDWSSDVCSSDLPYIRPLNRRHETVATPRQSRDVARPLLAIAKCLAQPRHVEPQATFLDRDIRPDPRHQVPLADNFVRARGQRSENVECAGAHFYRDGVPGEEPFARYQAEGTER